MSNMLLTLEGWASLQCQHVTVSQETRQDLPYHLLPALDHGDMFTDVEVVSRDGNTYRLHNTVLGMGDGITAADLHGKRSQTTFFGLTDLLCQVCPPYIESKLLKPILTHSHMHSEFGLKNTR